MGASSNTGTAKANGNAITATGTIFFHARVPISGWSNSAQIVGSFAGYTNVPGLYGGVDHFSASYGTTNSTTVCSASPCSYLDQIGTAITNITRIGVGQYVVNTPRTYAKLKCVFAPHDNASNFGAIFFNGGQCSNCNALTFSTASSGIGTGSSNYGDTWGNIMCDGQW